MLPSGTWSRMRSDALFLIETDPQHTFDERRLSLPKGKGGRGLGLLSERRSHFRAGWRLEFERGRRNRRARLVRIRCDDPVAVRQQHVPASAVRAHGYLDRHRNDCLGGLWVLRVFEHGWEIQSRE